MKQWLGIAAVSLCIISCKKEIIPSAKNAGISDETFFNSVKSELKDSLASIDFLNIDDTRWYKSKDVRSSSYFVRIAFQSKDLATDFILLRTDSLGDIQEGKIIHADKTNNTKNSNDLLFRGQFVINSLNREISTSKEVINGSWKKQPIEPSVLPAPIEEPAGTQDLPEVVVTSYTPSGNYSGDWYWYGGFFTETYNSGGSQAYTYGSSSGGNSSSNTTNTDNTIVIEVEANDDPTIRPEDYIKCFESIPDAGAQYQITIYSDIPVDGQPEKTFNWSTGSPGHCFVQLSKTSGDQAIQQNFGFYPKVGYKSLGPYPTEGKVVDNSGHEYNASLTQTLTSAEFQIKLSEIEILEGNDYDIENWNCTNFALSVFNAESSHPLNISPSHSGSNPAMQTPQGVYNQIKSLQSSGNKTYGNPSVPAEEQHVGNSHGSCGND